ncbi:hypothetical protein TEA_017731 [Camellia sinensis var. sinensis]|uniref:Nucleolus and neural progenitor protein-like N-terminal domain-containing protein n=1 Tax=Camellia sinensis var. sinensis TaxID=542762 RepID=A0A4S4DBC5_CAMSN|nr:hypothetical protein TEA_017731 [Camellia sinensis var. sinensis]
MGSEIEIVEERLKSFLGQLQTECGILDRIVYKNKNQHRRCSYFQYLLKVRRDLRLLQSAHIEEIVSSSFQVIHGTKPKQKVQLLESCKRCSRRQVLLECPSAMHNIKCSLRSKILLDVVTVFNMVSSLSQKEQSVKLTHEGFEVFTEYYPMKDQVVLLDCVWETDKFVLHERINKSQTECQDRETREVSLEASAIQYQSIEVLLGDLVLNGLFDMWVIATYDESGKEDPNCTSDGLAHIKVNNTCSFEGPVIENDDAKKIEHCSKVEDVSGSPRENLPSEIGLPTDSSSSVRSDPLKLKPGSKNKVAFISVNKPAVSTTNVTELHIKGTESRSDDKEDPFFSLLPGGNLKDSLF